MPKITLQQGRYSVDLAARELRVDGVPQPLEPRPFDVLAHLIRQRHRVVSRQELLQAVWGNEHASGGALASAVMKLRQALGDTDQSALIRTIPRVGYRLVAGVAGDEESVKGPAPGRDLGTSGAPLRVALLPVENLSGEPALDWVGLGLMALVSNLLSWQTELSTVAPASVITAQQGVHDASGIEAQDMVRRATGASVLVRSRLSRVEHAFRLDFECLGRGAELAGRVQAPHAVELGPRMLQPLLDLLAPGACVVGAFGMTDPLALAAYARGLQAAALQRSTQALHLFQMALDLTPESVAIQLELLNVICTIGDADQALPLMQRLIQYAEEHANLRLAARVHLAVGRLHLQCQSLRPAAFKLDKALRLMDEHETPDEVTLALQLRAVVASYMQDNATLQRHLAHAGELCARSGNRLLEMRRLNTLAVTAGLEGDFANAAELALQTAQLARELKATHMLLIASVNSAEYLSVLGRWQEAVVCSEEAYALSTLLKDLPSLCSALFGICWIYRLTRAPAAAQQAIRSMPSIDDFPGLHQQLVLQALGHHAASAGEHGVAARYFGGAVKAQREAGNWKNVYENLPWLICALVQSGQIERAEEELAVAGHAPYVEHAELQRQLLHDKALLAHAKGQPEVALGHLYRLLESSPAPLWRAWAALDAAWLQAEASRPQAAWAALEQLPSGFAEQALSWAVRARIHWAEGKQQAAQQAQARYAELAGPRSDADFFSRLSPCYQAGPSPQPPAAHWLPSRL